MEIIIIFCVLGFVLSYSLHLKETERVWRSVELSLLEFKLERLSKPTGNYVIDQINREHVEELRKLGIIPKAKLEKLK